MEETLLKCVKVNKSFSDKSILHNISLDINKGDSIAFVGDNGCGKSTLLKLLCGINSATSGTITVRKDLHISYIPDRFPKLNMTANQYILHIGLLGNDHKQSILKRKDDLFTKFQIKQYGDVSLKYLSKGTLQKIAIIQAIFMEPDILIMDEPLSGQDINSQYIFLDELKALLKKQVTLLMVCHEKLLLDKIAKTIYVIKDGALHMHNDFKIHDIQCVKVENNHNEIPHVIKEKSNSIIMNKELIRFYVNDEACNDLLTTLLSYNYKIKEVTYEDDEKLY